MTSHIQQAREAFKQRKSRSLKSSVPLVTTDMDTRNENSSVQLVHAKSLSNKHSKKLDSAKRLVSRSFSSAELEDLMFNAVMREDIETLKNCLADESVIIDHIGTNGYTALHQACEIGNLTMVIMLVDAGADLFVKTTNTGESALQLATKNGQFEIAEFLISIGAKDTEIKDGLSI